MWIWSFRARQPMRPRLLIIIFRIIQYTPNCLCNTNTNPQFEAGSRRDTGIARENETILNATLKLGRSNGAIIVRNHFLRSLGQEEDRRFLTSGAFTKAFVAIDLMEWWHRIQAMNMREDTDLQFWRADGDSIRIASSSRSIVQLLSWDYIVEHNILPWFMFFDLTHSVYPSTQDEVFWLSSIRNNFPQDVVLETATIYHDSYYHSSKSNWCLYTKLACFWKQIETLKTARRGVFKLLFWYTSERVFFRKLELWRIPEERRNTVLRCLGPKEPDPVTNSMNPARIRGSPFTLNVYVRDGGPSLQIMPTTVIHVRRLAYLQVSIDYQPVDTNLDSLPQLLHTSNTQLFLDIVPGLASADFPKARSPVPLWLCAVNFTGLEDLYAVYIRTTSHVTIPDFPPPQCRFLPDLYIRITVPGNI
ncbi:hypothetical protein C8Q75DRAFT_737816 [Abortiporus biennis]|nr:hypothetical protein C8Q75DRAFT_737816 [Abortiporus biennis]